MNKLEACKHYLNKLPDGYRERALSQIDEEVVHIKPSPYKSVNDAVACFCHWDTTKEGEDFWGDVYEHYEFGNPLPPLPNDKTTIQATEPRMSDSEAWVRFCVWRI